MCLESNAADAARRMVCAACAVAGAAVTVASAACGVLACVRACVGGYIVDCGGELLYGKNKNSL